MYINKGQDDRRLMSQTNALDNFRKLDSLSPRTSMNLGNSLPDVHRKNNTSSYISPQSSSISPNSLNALKQQLKKSNSLNRMESTDAPRAEVGLENLGNTCFMNSTLQCLLHIQPLVQYFLGGQMDTDLNPVSPKKGVLATSFRNLVIEMYRGNHNSAISPVNFQRAVFC